jgi:hypothetical protein
MVLPSAARWVIPVLCLSLGSLSCSQATPDEMNMMQLKSLEERADSGDLDTQWELFTYYDVPGDRVKSDQWFEKCIVFGNPRCWRLLSDIIQARALGLEPGHSRNLLVTKAKKLKAYADTLESRR